MKFFFVFGLLILLVVHCEGSCPGCPEEVLATDGDWPQNVKDAAEFAVEALGSEYELDRIMTAKTQVTSDFIAMVNDTGSGLSPSLHYIMMILPQLYLLEIRILVFDVQLI